MDDPTGPLSFVARYPGLVAVRKRLQKHGSSRALVIDQDLLRALLPDGDLEQTLLVEVVGDALLVRRETSEPIPTSAVAQAADQLASLPESAIELSATERQLLAALLEAPGTTTGLARRVDRARETVSHRLNRLRERGWVTKTGRDWRATDAGRARIETDPAARFAEHPAAVARLLLALEHGPATAAELEKRLGVKRGAVLSAIKQATAAGLVERDDLRTNAPVYWLTGPRS